MKQKLLYLFVSLLIPAVVHADDIIQFADANVKAICVENWDTNGDGELSKTEAAAVTSLGAVFKFSEITNFEELVYFTGLKSLESNVFRNSTLTNIALPNSVTSIETYAFTGCI